MSQTDVTHSSLFTHTTGNASSLAPFAYCHCGAQIDWWWGQKTWSLLGEINVCLCVHVEDGKMKHVTFSESCRRFLWSASLCVCALVCMYCISLSICLCICVSTLSQSFWKAVRWDYMTRDVKVVKGRNQCFESNANIRVLTCLQSYC